MIVATKTGILSQYIFFPNPNQVFFVPKNYQTISTTLSQHKIKNQTQRTVKLQYKEI